MSWLALLAVAFACGLGFTRAARNSATRAGLVDAPDGRRKMQTRPVPVAGGPAVLVAALVTLAVAASADHHLLAALTADPRRSLALLAAAVVITAVGLLDDARNLRPRTKLAGQVLAVAILVGPGDYLIESVSLLGWAVPLGPLSVPFTAFWFLACVNALNLIDGMDGLLGTVGLIALLTLGVMGLMVGHAFTAAVSLALAGAVLGFLWFNLPPASVYMGDAGSMLIGLAVGAVAIPASLKGPATVALVAPVAVLVLPMLDTTAAVVRRKLTGRGLATADRGHLHHVLQRHGLTTRRALMLVAALGLVAAGGALASTAMNNDLFAVMASGGVAAALLATRLFGNAEFTLVRAKVSSTVRGLVAPGRTGGAARELAVRLQGTADWGGLWRDLTGVADKMGLHTVCLDVNAPALHESYHARWDRAGAAPPEALAWHLDVPLFAGGHPIGRLTVTGGRTADPVFDQLAVLAKIVATAEERAAALAAPPAPAPRPAAATA